MSITRRKLLALAACAPFAPLLPAPRLESDVLVSLTIPGGTLFRTGEVLRVTGLSAGDATITVERACGVDEYDWSWTP